MKAANVDLWIFKIGSIVVVITLFILNGSLKWGFAVKDILMIGGFVFILGLPISVSMWIKGLEAVVRAKTGAQIDQTVTTVPSDTTIVPNPLQGQVD